MGTDLLIAKAARRATLKWKAGENLRQKLTTEGADPKSIQKAMNDLAIALREK
mgnify:CR=1 FL=1